MTLEADPIAAQSLPCAWAPPHNSLYRAYHDHEWGVPERDPRALWEKLVLDGFQAGLSWITILRKRDAFREAFDGFDPVKVARYDGARVEKLMSNTGIVRSRGKIEATIRGAQIWVDMMDRGDDFGAFLWDHLEGRPVQNAWRSYREAPTATATSETIAKALKGRGFRYCGPTIVYAFMQAVGMVNDHEIDCPRHVACAALA